MGIVLSVTRVFGGVVTACSRIGRVVGSILRHCAVATVKLALSTSVALLSRAPQGIDPVSIADLELLARACQEDHSGSWWDVIVNEAVRQLCEERLSNPVDQSRVSINHGDMLLEQAPTEAEEDTQLGENIGTLAVKVPGTPVDAQSERGDYVDRKGTFEEDKESVTVRGDSDNEEVAGEATKPRGQRNSTVTAEEDKIKARKRQKRQRQKARVEAERMQREEEAKAIAKSEKKRARRQKKKENARISYV
ncbi:hypothetical protein K490DRAFT_53336 [Saccharata proteae CBS 121410]|uniref:Uncharacterized protein n=1 Tax=Saccharata proteae CBS 121410 TaxID=1314787 RepID=A0A9P4I494_9PEZI|nr:hypothetical protein K490DRAFT_53336 [Saccharata proteae CBS 121410]